MLIVDAYNVLHVTGVLPPDLAGLDAPALAELLGRTRWASRAILVCDGVKPRGWPARVGGVDLRFAGPGRDADTLIERLISDDPDPRRLTVVSSDGRIRKAARRAKCRALSSEGFLAQVVAQVQAPRARRASPAAGKPEVPLDPFALRRWLDEFGVTPEELRRMAGETARLVKAPAVGDTGPSTSLPRAGLRGAKERPSPAPPSRGKGVDGAAPSRGSSSSGDLSDAAMRSMLADALKMWAAADLPADVDLTAWLDSLLTPPSPPSPPSPPAPGSR